MRILIVEDDARIAEPVADDLRRQMHVVDVAEDGPGGLTFARSAIYDVIVLDIMLPGIDGLEVCRQLRESGVASMVLMLTARDALGDKVTSLDAGADDYLTKPFALEELSARIRALGRRPLSNGAPMLRHGALALDPKARLVFVDGQELTLTPMEFALIEVFLRHPRQVFSRSMLLDKIATFDAGSSEDSVKVHVTNVRRKLRERGYRNGLIMTVYGQGYRLAEPA